MLGQSPAPVVTLRYYCLQPMAMYHSLHGGLQTRY